jgi:glycine reductase complex component B subunit alpha and beta
VGSSTGWDDGVLRLDLDALRGSTKEEPSVLEMRADVVKPGESVRLVNVLDAVEPQVKGRSPEVTFPGALGDLSIAGEGLTHRIDGVAILSTAELAQSKDTPARDIQDGIVDMLGPGESTTPWSRTTNIVLSFERSPGVPLVEFDSVVRRATLRVARDIAATTLDRTPDAIDHLGTVEPADGLPSVAAIVQLGGESPLYDTFFYGTTIRGRLPMTVAPTEVLDGAVTAGAYHWAALRNPTAFYQRNQLLLELLAAHGSRIDFRGVVLTRAYYMSAEDKWRNALLAAKLARQLGAEAAILTTDAGGNSHTDTMLTCRACEQLGVRTTVIMAEMGGLTDRVPEADSIVSVGNVDELVAEWRPDRVLGGAALVDGRPAGDAGPIPLRNYLGAANQMGQLSITAVPA